MFDQKANLLLNQFPQVPGGTASRTTACTSTSRLTDRRRWSASCRREVVRGGGRWAPRWATSPNSWTCLGVARHRRTPSSPTGPRKKAPLWDCSARHWLASRGLTWSQPSTAPRRGSRWSDSPLSPHPKHTKRLKSFHLNDKGGTVISNTPHPPVTGGGTLIAFSVFFLNKRAKTYSFD